MIILRKNFSDEIKVRKIEKKGLNFRKSELPKMNGIPTKGRPLRFKGSDKEYEQSAEEIPTRYVDMYKNSNIEGTGYSESDSDE